MSVVAPARPVRFAVLGCGWIARDHVVPALRAVDEAELAVVFDPDRDRAEALGAPRVADDVADALRDVDAVYVASPNHLHRPLVEAAAAAGCDVLCEKPMATSLADAEAMVAACARAGVRYATAHNQRFHPAHVRLRDLVAAGALGQVTQARIHYACSAPPWWDPASDWHFDPARAGGGAVFDLAPHGIDLIGVLTATLPAQVVALRQRAVLREHPVEDGGVVALRYEGRRLDDLLGVVQVSYACPEALPRRRLELVGTKGMAVALDTMGQTPGGTLELVHAADGRCEAVDFDRDGDPFAAQVRAFALGRTEAADRDLATMRALEEAMA